MAALTGGVLVVHFTNRKNAALLFFHMTGDATASVDRRKGFTFRPGTSVAWVRWSSLTVGFVVRISMNGLNQWAAASPLSNL